MAERFYGADGTIHQTQQLDVETDDQGTVVAVWFRCQPLSFKQSKTISIRAQEMIDMYKRNPAPALIGVTVDDEKRG